jgi:general secretion pathway protein E
MQMTSNDFLAHLSSRARLTDVAAERVRRVQLETSDRLPAVLLKLGMLSEADLAAEMAAFSGHPCVAPDVTLARADIAELAVTDSFLRAHQLVPLAKDDTGLRVACWDALDEYAARALAFACEVPIRWTIATRAQIEKAQQAGAPTSEAKDSNGLANAFEDEEIERLKDLASEAPIIRRCRQAEGIGHSPRSGRDCAAGSVPPGWPAA